MKESLIGRLVRRARRSRPVGAAEGYDQWSLTYDSDSDNPVTTLESKLFSELLGQVSFEGKTVVDIGCGTGRHWPEILSQHPAKLLGVDSSSGMLAQLKLRQAHAELICSAGDRLEAFANDSCDVIISTLALAHAPDPALMLVEWSRILCPGGAMLITDFHPDAIHAGMKRTFVSHGETIEIEHHTTEIAQLRRIAVDCGLEVVFASESAIDDAVRPSFEEHFALERYEKYRGLRLVFGLCLKKP